MTKQTIIEQLERARNWLQQQPQPLTDTVRRNFASGLVVLAKTIAPEVCGPETPPAESIQDYFNETKS